MTFNLIDIIIAFTLVASILFFSYKGLVMAVFDFFALFISMALAYILYPNLVSVIRSQQIIMDPLLAAVSEKLGLQAIGEAATRQAESSFINSVELPEFIKKLLQENNNPEIYRILGVNSLSDYISGYIANMIISLLSLLAVFMLTLIAVKLVGLMLDVASRLPVVNTLNKIGGAALGLVIGIFFVYIILAVLSVVITHKNYPELIMMIEQSRLAELFYEGKIFTDLISRLF